MVDYKKLRTISRIMVGVASCIIVAAAIGRFFGLNLEIMDKIVSVYLM